MLDIGVIDIQITIHRLTIPFLCDGETNNLGLLLGGGRRRKEGEGRSRRDL